MTLHDMIIHDLYFLSKGNELKRLHVCHGIVSEIIMSFQDESALYLSASSN